MSEENPVKEVTEPVKEAAEEVAEPPIPEPEEHEEEHEEHDDTGERLSRVESGLATVIETLNSLKEASPVTPAEEEILDQTPIRKPWTHRNPFARKD